MSLSDVEREITRDVVSRFLNEKSPSLRRDLVIRYKAPELIDALETKSILRKSDPNNDGRATLFPKLLAFQYCGDDEIRENAKEGVTLTLMALHDLFISEADKTMFDASEVEAAARKRNPKIGPQAIRLGLYLINEFNVLRSYSYSAEGTELTNLAPNERVVAFDSADNAVKEWDAVIDARSRYLRRTESVPNNFESRVAVPLFYNEEMEAMQIAASSDEDSEGAADNSAPIVFVSYSWDDLEHRRWVLEFATRLRAEGVDVILDQWHLQPGADRTKFMEQSVVTSDFVVLVCTPGYAERANDRVGGVGYEALVITGVLAQKIDIGKFIPVLRSGDFESSLPHWIKAKIGVDLRGKPYSEAEHERLLRTIHGEHITAPPLGTKPVWKSIPASTSTDATAVAKVSELADTPKASQGLAEDSPRIAMTDRLKLAAERRAWITVSPIVPHTAKNKFQVVGIDWSNDCLKTEKEGSDERLEIPLSQIADLLHKGESRMQELHLKGRLQWLTLKEEWTVLPDKSESDFGVAKISSQTTPHILEVKSMLEARGYGVGWANEDRVTLGYGTERELFYDEDGKYLLHSSRPFNQMLVKTPRR